MVIIYSQLHGNNWMHRWHHLNHSEEELQVEEEVPDHSGWCRTSEWRRPEGVQTCWTPQKGSGESNKHFSQAGFAEQHLDWTMCGFLIDTPETLLGAQCSRDAANRVLTLGSCLGHCYFPFCEINVVVLLNLFQVVLFGWFSCILDMKFPSFSLFFACFSLWMTSDSHKKWSDSFRLETLGTQRWWQTRTTFFYFRKETSQFVFNTTLNLNCF